MKLIPVFLWLITFTVECCEDALWAGLSCPKPSDTCKCVKKGSYLLCCHINSLEDFSSRNGLDCPDFKESKVSQIHLRNITLNSINATLWDWHVKAFTISDSRVKRIEGKFKGKLNCVSLSGIGLEHIENKVFLSLPNLQTLDLSNNNLTSVPQIAPSDSEVVNITLDISGNGYIRCHSVSDLLDGLQNSSNNLNFINNSATFCLSSQSYNWFNSTEKVPLEQLVMLRKLEQQCPRDSTYNCHCRPFGVDILPGQFPTYNAKVDCSGQHLFELPLHLPPNTKFLNVSNNNITSLNHLSKESYQHIRELYADNNQIKSISELEGSYFMENFAVLSLRGNNLTSVPTYFLSNAFDRNRRVSNVKLGGNKLSCDCNTAQVLKVWLMANKEYIPDYEEVLCARDLEKVIFLDQNKVCIYKKEWTDYIYYIIAGEVLLLVFLISKVSYDYWVFKSTGYLPWPASKMPKLPCDWVFES